MEQCSSGVGEGCVTKDSRRSEKSCSPSGVKVGSRSCDRELDT